MKKKRSTIFRSFICLAIMIISISCSNHEDKPFTDHTEITKAFTTGQWKIIGFTQEKIQKKNNYEAYKFGFSADDKITVTDNVHQYYGRWSVLSIDGEDDAPSSDISFVMAFDAKSGFSSLNASWEIIERTPSKLILRKVSQSKKHLDLVVFEKI